MKAFSKVILLSSIFSISLFSCIQGEVGPQGLDGLNGYNGRDGYDGTNGKNGLNGLDGSIVAYSSNTVTLHSADWSTLGPDFMGTISVPSLTQSIVNSGIVMVYEKSDPLWNGLPFTWNNVAVTFDFGLNVVHVYYANVTDALTVNPGVRTFRIVTMSAVNAVAYSSMNWNNYSEVKKALNLAN